MSRDWSRIENHIKSMEENRNLFENSLYIVSSNAKPSKTGTDCKEVGRVQERCSLSVS